MTGNTSLNICIPPEFYYTWIAVYDDHSCLAELDGQTHYSIHDIDQEHLTSLIICSADMVFRLDARTGQFYHNYDNITPWDDVYDVRGCITEYRHARYSSATRQSVVYARSLVWQNIAYRASLKLYIPGNAYDIERVHINDQT